MTRSEFDAFCASLPGTTHVIQWGGASVWKVGGKIFAIWGGDDANGHISFKASDLTGEMLRERPQYQPAPYLARAGWMQLISSTSVEAGETEAYVAAAHQLIAAKLPRRVKLELGLA
ncbi:MAG: MmcQ/YjbR family DNA-binding protein [Pannonibacter sp.]|jgi:predicted DNA-binding protein (MmcQ/YjbR family)